MRAQRKRISDSAQFRDALKAKGLKNTPQRTAIHDAVMNLGHASADMVCRYLEEKGDAKICVASVYNILSQFVSTGILSSVMSKDNKMYFDANTARHIHLYDEHNHEFMDIEDEELVQEVEKKLLARKFRGYKSDAVEIQIICHPTRRNKTKTK